MQAVSPDKVNLAQDEVVAQLRRLRRVPCDEENDFESNDSLTSMFKSMATTIAAAGGRQVPRGFALVEQSRPPPR